MHPSEQQELRIWNGVIDLQLDNYHHGVIRLGVFEDGPKGDAAIAKMTWWQAREVAHALLAKADWMRDCERAVEPAWKS